MGFEDQELLEITRCRSTKLLAPDEPSRFQIINARPKACDPGDLLTGLGLNSFTQGARNLFDDLRSNGDCGGRIGGHDD